MIQFRRVYWLKCDACGSLSKDSIRIERGNIIDAEHQAEQSGWYLQGGDGQRHYCADCKPNVCSQCGHVCE